MELIATVAGHLATYFPSVSIRGLPALPYQKGSYHFFNYALDGEAHKALDLLRRSYQCSSLKSSCSNTDLPDVNSEWRTFLTCNELSIQEPNMRFGEGYRDTADLKIMWTTPFIAECIT